jgi:hypothetical protein
MWRAMLTAAAFAASVAAFSSQPLDAAGLATTRATPHHGRAPCGPCGCVSVVYVYHRELQSTYGLGYDPRNYDATQPRYYFGAIRAYPRYLVDRIPGWC